MTLEKESAFHACKDISYAKHIKIVLSGISFISTGYVWMSSYASNKFQAFWP